MAQKLTSFDRNEVRVLHIEPTTKCNLACPQCHRTIGAPYYNHMTNRSELTLQSVMDTIDVELVAQLQKVFMCGNFGEPVACKEIVSIYKYFRTFNPTVTLGLNTHGGLRTPAWWKMLAEIFALPLDYVTFAIDGLEDTHKIYRVNSDLKKTFKNAEAYIQAGGSAHWEMLIFEHNEHQVEQCKQLAYDMGFTWFRAKVSKRFDYSDTVKPPAGYVEPEYSDKEIDCHALEERSIYLAANGEIMPCCFFGSEVFSLDQRGRNLCHNTEALVSSWVDTPHRICQYNCGTQAGKTRFKRQWNIEAQLR